MSPTFPTAKCHRSEVTDSLTQPTFSQVVHETVTYPAHPDGKHVPKHGKEVEKEEAAHGREVLLCNTMK